MKASKRLCIIQKSSVWIILTISKNTFWDEIPCRLDKDIKDNFSVQDDFNPNNELKKEVPVSKYDLNGHYKIVEKSNRAYCALCQIFWYQPMDEPQRSRVDLYKSHNPS